MLPAPVIKTKQEIIGERWLYYHLALWRGGYVFKGDQFIELAEGMIEQEDIRNFVLNRLWMEKHYGIPSYKRLEALDEHHGPKSAKAPRSLFGNRRW